MASSEQIAAAAAAILKKVPLDYGMTYPEAKEYACAALATTEMAEGIPTWLDTRPDQASVPTASGGLLVRPREHDWSAPISSADLIEAQAAENAKLKIKPTKEGRRIAFEGRRDREAKGCRCSRAK